MPVTEKIYPDWVQAYRTRGKQSIKKEIRIIFTKGHPNVCRKKVSAAGRYLYRHHHTGRVEKAAG